MAEKDGEEVIVFREHNTGKVFQNSSDFLKEKGRVVTMGSKDTEQISSIAVTVETLIGRAVVAQETLVSLIGGGLKEEAKVHTEGKIPRLEYNLERLDDKLASINQMLSELQATIDP